MKEVYVITRGAYSDYGIDCIFTDLEKATKYVELQNNDEGEDYRIETYPLDEVVFEGAKVIEIKARKERGKDEYEFTYEIIDLIDDGWNVNRNLVSISDFSFDKSSSITLRRKLKNEGDDLREKYKKVVEDYFFKIEANWDYYKEYEARKLLSETLEKDVDNVQIK